MLLFVVASESDSYSERFFWGSPRVKTLRSKFVKICQNQFIRRCTWNHSKLRFIHSILHFSNNNNNIHGSINDDECIKKTSRFLKIYPRETSRREVKLWSGLSRYFDRVNEFCCLTRTEKKGDRSFVRSFVIILLHDDACTHQSRCCSWHWHFFFFFFFFLKNRNFSVLRRIHEHCNGTHRGTYCLSSFLVKATSF